MIYKLSQQAIERIIEISIKKGVAFVESEPTFVILEMAKKTINEKLGLELNLMPEEEFEEKYKEYHN